ncbi:hypothetical protein ACFUTX_06760 [Microbacterium sp. NPDC057407]|uniref:hypothetical protein n=1 Tax=Microbacterium sp. NPDC057407 TaxID=3346120 RepID=UPI00366D66C9
MSAPKPRKFAEMVSAWDDPEAFAALVQEYYASVAAERSAGARDFTLPLHSADVE